MQNLVWVRAACSQHGQQMMEPLWSPVVATGGNPSQMVSLGRRRK